jgi:hypothetical protein
VAFDGSCTGDLDLEVLRRWHGLVVPIQQVYVHVRALAEADGFGGEVDLKFYRARRFPAET